MDTKHERYSRFDEAVTGSDCVLHVESSSSARVVPETYAVLGSLVDPMDPRRVTVTFISFFCMIVDL